MVDTDLEIVLHFSILTIAAVCIQKSMSGFGKLNILLTMLIPVN